jgi:23S rRNA pseudouridine1911/1915/1917 synthase
MKNPSLQPLASSLEVLFTIPPALAGQRLDKALAVLAAEGAGQRQGSALSRARLQALLAEGHVARNGKPVSDASRKVKEGEIYALRLPPPEPAAPKAQKIALKVVYEDDDLLVIDKPPGLVTHPAPGNRDNTLVNALLAHCGASLSGIGGVARPGIVHRLDKDTSGLIVVAKNDLAHQALSAQFADKSLSRTYQALVHGAPTLRAGIVDAPIGRNPRDRKKMAVTARGKPARTRYRLLESFGAAALVECALETGRTHQIRVHMAHSGHPVIGDPVYGGGRAQRNIYDFPRQALHAAAIKFIHPRSGKAMAFASPLPPDMRALLKRLRSGG